MRNEIVKSNIPNTPVRIASMCKARHKGLCVTAHFHDEIEILYISCGRFKIENEDVSIIAHSGDLVFINSRVVHSTMTEEDNTKTGFVQFDASIYSGDYLKSISKYLKRFVNSNDNQIVHFKNGEKETEELKGYIKEIFDENETKRNSYEIYINANIYKILGFLYRYSIIADEKKFFDIDIIEKVLPVLNYIDTNYQDEITLEKLSKVVNLNQYYLCRLFKKATNSTFTEYLNFVRVCKAEKLLFTTSKTVSEISMDVGFSSVSYFNRVFKKIKSCTPSDYKKIKYLLN